jgi:hypothetical protein
MAEHGSGASEAARVITIERLMAEPSGGRSRERFEQVLVTAQAYGAYRSPATPVRLLRLPGYDLSRLTEAEREQLERLLDKARSASGGED